MVWKFKLYMIPRHICGSHETSYEEMNITKDSSIELCLCHITFEKLAARAEISFQDLVISLLY